MPPTHRLAALACVLAVGCGTKDAPKEPPPDAGPPPPLCPGSDDAPTPLPGVRPEHLRLDYWLETLAAQADLDAVLLTPEDIVRLNASLRVPREGLFPQLDLLAPLDAAKLDKDVAERLRKLSEELGAGKLVLGDGARISAADLAVLDRGLPPGGAEPVLRVAVGDVPIHCAPLSFSFHSAPPMSAAGATPATGPAAPPATGAIDRRYDRNACSAAHTQEVVQVLAVWPNGQLLARTRYALGWIAADAALSPPLPAPLHEAFVAGPRLQATAAVTGEGGPLPAGTLLAAADKPDTAHLATAAGFVTARLPGGLRSTRRPLTRRALLEEVWRYAGAPYGLGDAGGGRDCSRLLLDAFESFDLHLPRHSAWQALAGSFSIDTSQVTEAERLRLLDAAARHGLVLLHFPGHIMLYLGRDKAGVPMGYHAFGEYLRPCPAGTRPERDKPETLVRVASVTVSDLELGRGTSRRAFAERVSRITVLGPPPGPDLEGVAELRPPAPMEIPKKCRHGATAALFVSPGLPNADQPLHVVASTSQSPGAATLTLVDPRGVRHPEGVVRLGGPPWGMAATVKSPAPGTWTALYGDGDEVLACQRFHVKREKPDDEDDELPETDGPIWPVLQPWGKATERLYSLFVERLFDYPYEEDPVWTNLHTLLRDPERNILYNHLGLDEDDKLVLGPDCADLPYALRTYFAWKLRLPVGYHACSRAKPEEPPRCEWLVDELEERERRKNDGWRPEARELEKEREKERRRRERRGEPPEEPREPETAAEMLVRRQLAGAADNLMSRLELGERRGAARFLPRDDLAAFSLFLKTKLLVAAHSSSGRTQPDRDGTDLYPVPLTREALRPGTVFVDPYGHVLVIADWLHQGAGDRYGVLVGADAQPDGTIGRRRFWRGSFLFRPEVALGGAGFKAFRPRVLVAEPITVDVVDPAAAPDAAPVPVPRAGYTVELSNAELARSHVFTPYSLQQYQGSADDFYETVEALANPRPLDPVDRQLALLDAFEEAARRRVVSVQNGEEFMAQSQYAPMAMPEGAKIFLAPEPWESYATPSRDLRLLISIDTIVGFAETVRKRPAQYAVAAADLDRVVAKVVERRDAELLRRTIAYVRSDGSKATLTLRDLVDRARLFEVAYNPNDCVEVRWAAPPESEEARTCQRRAPAEQEAEMERLRGWFATRDRPAN